MPSGGNTGVPVGGPDRDSEPDIANSTGSVADHDERGPVGAEVGDRQRHQLRVTIGQLAQDDLPRGAPGLPAVDDDVGSRDEFDERLAVVGRRADPARQLRLLALCTANGMLAPASAGQGARGRDAAGRLDLEHVGAQIGEQAGSRCR